MTCINKCYCVAHLTPVSHTSIFTYPLLPFQDSLITTDYLSGDKITYQPFLPSNIQHTPPLLHHNPHETQLDSRHVRSRLRLHNAPARITHLDLGSEKKSIICLYE